MLSRKRSRDLKTTLVLLLVFVILAFAGGCDVGGSDGSGGGGRQKLYVLGDMHGDLSEEIAELLDCAAFIGDERDAPLLISHESDFAIDAGTALALREILEAGHAVCVEHVNEAEANALLEALGFEGNFVMPSGYTYVEFYGIRLTGDGDVLSLISLNDDESKIDRIMSSPDSIMVREGVVVSSDWEYEQELVFSPDELVLLAELGLTVSGDDIMSGDRIITSADVLSGDLVLSMDGTWVHRDDFFGLPDDLDDAMEPDEIAEAEMTMAASIVEWLYSTDAPEEARRSKEGVRKELSVRGAGDLTQIASMYQRTYDASEENQTFRIIVEVYGCHTFNEADGSESDWFIVKQKGLLNPSGRYSKKAGRTGFRDIIEGYMVYYSFDNYLVDVSGDFINTEVELQQPRPESTVGSSGISSGVSFNFGGNVGFNGKAAAGSLSMGASYSTSDSHTTSDCVVTNESLASANGVIQNRAKWKYSFTRPWTTGAKFFGANSFVDAPTAARALFQPVNQWAWEISPSQRENVKGFDFDFKWQNGRSYGESYAFGIRADDVQHRDWESNTTTFNVPFDMIYPPLIAANELDFSKSSGYKKLEMATCRNWVAESDKTWCQLSRTSGGRNDVGDIYVTVDENTTGDNREAYITLKTADGKGTFKVKVFQARN